MKNTPQQTTETRTQSAVTFLTNLTQHEGKGAKEARQKMKAQGFTDDEIRIAALVCGELFEQKRNYFLRIYKDSDNWLLGLLPAGLAGLLAILLFGLEHRLPDGP